MSEHFRLLAMQEARWASTHEDNQQVCARFAVDIALHKAKRTLPFYERPPGTWIYGEPAVTYFDALKNTWVLPCREPLSLAPDDDDASSNLTEQRDPEDLPEEPDATIQVPLSHKDLAAIRALTAWSVAQEGAFAVSASWAPEHIRAVYSCDVVRPPMEALALVRDAVQGLACGQAAFNLSETPAVLFVGGGWGGAAQALSALLRRHQVFHIPSPYHDLAATPPIRWELVVLNVPSLLHWRAAEVAAQPKEIPSRKDRASIARAKGKEGGEHVKMLVDTALAVTEPECLVVLMADVLTYRQAVGHLKSRGTVVPVPAHGHDTSRLPLWVGYDRQPWTPHTLPRPTGRCVSFWRVSK